MRAEVPEVLEASADWLRGGHLRALAGGRLDVLHVLLGLDLDDGGFPVDHRIQNIIENV